MTSCSFKIRIQFSLVIQSCPTLCDPMNHSMPGLPVHHPVISWSPPKPMSIESVMPSNHLILCRTLLLLPSIFPSIRVFSNESALRIMWPKYWSFSFNSSPSNGHPGLIWIKRSLFPWRLQTVKPLPTMWETRVQSRVGKIS